MNQKKKQNNEVLDLLRTRPHWLIRHGISLLLGLVVLLFSGSYFVHLPNIITADAVLLANANDSTVWRLRLPHSLHSFLSSGQSLRLQFNKPHATCWSVTVVKTAAIDSSMTDCCEFEVRAENNPPTVINAHNETPCQVEIVAGSYRLGDKLFNPFGKNEFSTDRADLHEKRR